MVMQVGWHDGSKLADWLIFVAYVLIPIQLLLVLRSVPVPSPVKRLRLGFFAFILTCGVTHLATALDASHEAITILKVICSFVSLATVVMLAVHFTDLVRMLQRGYDLENRVAYLEDEALRLQKLNEKASDLATAKTNFIATISHEIRTPLNAVLGASELVMEESNYEQKTQYLQLIQDSGSFLLNLLNDIIDVAQIERGIFKPTLVDFPIHKMINSAMLMLNDRAKLKSLVIESDVSSSLPPIVHSDERRIQQVLVNLVSNAFKFTNTGGMVRVSVSVHPVSEVEEMASAPGVHRCQRPLGLKRKDMIVFTVTDSGCGIAPGSMSRIFNRFEQADGTITRKYGGTGLGLYIVREVIHALNGLVFVSSKPGVGSKFSFAVPLLPLKTKTSQQLVLPEDFADRASRIRILVAEDNPTNQVIFLRMLNRIGCTDVVLVENGQEAMDKVKADPQIEIVLMDMHMPVMDGVTATEAIRSNPARPSPYIVLVSAEEVVNWKSLQFDSAILKPCTMESLKQAILNYMKSRDCRSNLCNDDSVQICL